MFCASCGMALADTDRFCRKCGHAISETTEAQPKQEPEVSRQGPSLGRILLALSGVALLIVLIISAIPKNSGGDGTQSSFRSNASDYLRNFSKVAEDLALEMSHADEHKAVHLSKALDTARAMESRAYQDYEDRGKSLGFSPEAGSIKADIDYVHATFQKAIDQFLTHRDFSDSKEVALGGDNFKQSISEANEIAIKLQAPR